MPSLPLCTEDYFLNVKIKTSFFPPLVFLFYDEGQAFMFMTITKLRETLETDLEGRERERQGQRQRQRETEGGRVML